MIQDRICGECDRSFNGGPRAYYCPSCRKERQRIQSAEYKQRKRAGNIRPLGSKDTCERCGKSYTVEGSNQRFCSECKPIHYAEYDRATSIDFYHYHKDHINPLRNERRRVGERNCDWCGKTYVQTNKSLTCGSSDCQRELKNKKWREMYHRRRNPTT